MTEIISLETVSLLISNIITQLFRFELFNYGPKGVRVLSGLSNFGQVPRFA